MLNVQSLLSYVAIHFFCEMDLCVRLFNPNDDIFKKQREMVRITQLQRRQHFNERRRNVGEIEEIANELTTLLHVYRK